MPLSYKIKRGIKMADLSGLLDAISLKGVMYVFLAIVILILVVILLYFLEKKVRKKIEQIKSDRNTFYKKEIKNLIGIKLSEEKMLGQINSLAKEFFREAFDIPYSMEYSEMIEKFKTMRKREAISFCNLISELEYSGHPLDKNKIQSLLRLLEKIIEKNRIISQEEKGKKRKEIPIIPEVKTPDLRKEHKEFLSVQKQEKPIEIPMEKIPQGKTRSSFKWKNRIKEIDFYREEINRILYSFSMKPKMFDITRYEFGSEEYHDYIRENKKEFNDIISLLANLKHIHKKFKMIFGELYKESDNEQRIELKKFADKWHNEQSDALKGITNPFKNQLVASKVLEKYMTKLGVMILTRFL